MKPSLIHGDLWYANAGIDIDSGQPLVFDACCFFAHNECELSLQSSSVYSLISADSKMSLVSGGQPVIGLEMNMLRHITNLLKYHPLKKISKAVWISIDCKLLSIATLFLSGITNLT